MVSSCTKKVPKVKIRVLAYRLSQSALSRASRKLSRVSGRRGSNEAISSPKVVALNEVASIQINGLTHSSAGQHMITVRVKGCERRRRNHSGREAAGERTISGEISALIVGSFFQQFQVNQREGKQPGQRQEGGGGGFCQGRGYPGRDSGCNRAARSWRYPARRASSPRRDQSG